MKTAVSFQNLLLAFFVFIGLMLTARIFYSGKLHYLFLIWNLFLAWVPLAMSKFLQQTNNSKRWKQALVFCCWLAFFPNALYIVTDLIHLSKESIVPKWFDAVLLFSSSLLGLIMAFASLHRIEQFFQTRINRKFQSFFTILMLFLGSFGVYLGRFLRWNSWDIISNPLELLLSICHRIAFPFDHIQTWNVTITLTIFFYLIYLFIKKMPGYLSQANN